VADASATVTITDLTGYLTQSITSAIKSATPLRDIPQSINCLERPDQRSVDPASPMWSPSVSSHQGEVIVINLSLEETAVAQTSL
jgi:hypothetical protein